MRVSPNGGRVRAVSRPLLLLVMAGCAASDLSVREQRIVETLFDDNFVAARRDPELVALKLRKMQRGRYEWLRGTAALYWRDLMEPGAPRPATTFGDPESSRVLLLGDPHAENVGTFRAADGTMFLDWNDFDATGYGPFTGDLRRTAASFAIIADLGGTPLGPELARLVAEGYAEMIATIAAGTRIGAVTFGAGELFDDELDKARTRGDALFAIDELAPVIDGVRELALGDLEAVAPDGVIEDRVIAVSEPELDMLARAIAQWRTGKLDPAHATIKLAARRIGSGIASYPAFRYQLVLEGTTVSPDDDRIVELKETREGLVMRGLPILQGGEWPNPAARAVDTQLRLHVRPDGDALLGFAQVGGVALKIRDREAYQRGIDHEDLADLAADDPDQLRSIARIYGGLLARAHGQALTADRLRGVTVIAPLLAGREAAFAGEMASLAMGDAAVIAADHTLMKDHDLAALLNLEGP
jgi:uncharacterized protein (DUF2252 family)